MTCDQSLTGALIFLCRRNFTYSLNSCSSANVSQVNGNAHRSVKQQNPTWNQNCMDSFSFSPTQAQKAYIVGLVFFFSLPLFFKLKSVQLSLALLQERHQPCSCGGCVVLCLLTFNFGVSLSFAEWYILQIKCMLPVGQCYFFFSSYFQSGLFIIMRRLGIKQHKLGSYII